MRLQWKKFLRILGLSALLCTAFGSALAATPVANTETIVFFRHGEKPALGLGQLTCQGENRALALPKVLFAAYGTPNYIFAPDPSGQTSDSGVLYDYVRPLATVEPTAIQAGLPVNTSYDYNDIKSLQEALLNNIYENSLIFVAWEHAQIVNIVQNIMSALGGDSSVVPSWKKSDFDSIYVLRIINQNGTTTVQFSQDYENLNNQSATCPS